MADEEFARLSDNPLSAAMLNIAAEWAAEVWPLKPGTEAAGRIMDERIQVMAIALQKLWTARYPPERAGGIGMVL